MTRGLRKIITVFLVAITFLVVPAFGYSQSMQAQAKPVDIQVDSYTVDSNTIERVQDKAEDLGDRPERRIGDTGLKNIKNLGENIPETLQMRARQDARDANKGSNNLNDAQNPISGAIDSAKQAIENVFD